MLITMQQEVWEYRLTHQGDTDMLYLKCENTAQRATTAFAHTYMQL